MITFNIMTFIFLFFLAFLGGFVANFVFSAWIGGKFEKAKKALGL